VRLLDLNSHIYTYILECIHVYTCIHLHTLTQVAMRKRQPELAPLPNLDMAGMCVCVCACVCVCLDMAGMCVCVCVCVCVLVHMYMCVYICTWVYTYVRDALGNMARFVWVNLRRVVCRVVFGSSVCVLLTLKQKPYGNTH